MKFGKIFTAGLSLIALSFCCNAVGSDGVDRGWNYLLVGMASSFTTVPDQIIYIEPSSLEAVGSGEAIRFCPNIGWICGADEMAVLMAPPPGLVSWDESGYRFVVREVPLRLMGEFVGTHMITVDDASGREIYKYHWSCRKGISAISLVGDRFPLADTYYLMEARGPFAATQGPAICDEAL